MDILINELSLTGQFASEEQFVNDALLPLVALLNEVDYSKDMLYKKYDFYSCRVTVRNSIHDIIFGSISRQYDEIRKFKSQLSRLFCNPYWEDNQKHSANCVYLYNNENVCGYSIAEACERDRIVISFTPSAFSATQLPVVKGGKTIILDNLFRESHYWVMMRKRNIIPCFSLKDTARFKKTQMNRQGQPIYKDIKTGDYWYLDNLHKNHYEVFDSNKKHIGEADSQGNIDTSKRVNGRML